MVVVVLVHENDFFLVIKEKFIVGVEGNWGEGVDD
jgi:hypothetical protein